MIIYIWNWCHVIWVNKKVAPQRRRGTDLEVQRTVLIQVVFDERLFFLSLKVDKSWWIQDIMTPRTDLIIDSFWFKNLLVWKNVGHVCIPYCETFRSPLHEYVLYPFQYHWRNRNLKESRLSHPLSCDKVKDASVCSRPTWNSWAL